MKPLPWNNTSWIEKHAVLLAQEVHISLGALFVLAGQLFYKAPFLGAAFILIAAAVKEFTFDLIVEKDTVLGGLFDLVVYGVGCLLAFGALYLYGFI